ncbi:hypothetical protein [Rhodococcoides fascians]|uniref:hypothetical protein n=1 Tax=Rhodococcoides fascians TaxID=1828 RepID=UPI000562CCA9|nr:hypothetical protein [Rhodococcus fascians]
MTVYFEQNSDVDLGRPTAKHDPDAHSVTVTWHGPGLAVVLNEAEACDLAELILETLNEG